MKSPAADLFREIVSIGASQSSAALAERVGKPVRITVPTLRELQVGDVSEALGSAEQPVEAGVALLDGSFRGGMMLVLAEEEVDRLRAALGVSPGRAEELEGHVEQMLGAFTAVVAQFLATDLRQEAYRYLRDMGGSLLPSLLAELHYEIDSIWVVEVGFAVEGESIIGRIFFLADMRFYQLLDQMAG